MRVDFDVEADEPYQFSVYRRCGSAPAISRSTSRSHLDKDGMLIVEQFMTNSAEHPVDFKCYLYAKGYRRQRTQVYRLGATPDRKVYRYPNGAELVGKELMLEAEEIGGERVLEVSLRGHRRAADEGTPTTPNKRSRSAQASRRRRMHTPCDRDRTERLRNQVAADA